jgi:hypothetical protein
MDNLLMAGGAISRCFNSTDGIGPGQDIDFFVYGLTPEQATERFKEFVRQLKLIIKTMYPNWDMACSRNEICWTAELDCSIKIQFVFMIYASITEILHSFDLPSSSIGFDGRNVYFTPLSLYCYKHCINPVDTTKASTTYGKRLAKYWIRGFDIVFPNLDTSKLTVNAGRATLDLPNMYFDIILGGNVMLGIATSKIRYTKPCEEYGTITSDARLFNTHHVNEPRRLIRVNLRDLDDLITTEPTFELENIYGLDIELYNATVAFNAPKEIQWIQRPEREPLKTQFFHIDITPQEWYGKYYKALDLPAS